MLDPGAGTTLASAPVHEAEPLMLVPARWLLDGTGAELEAQWREIVADAANLDRHGSNFEPARMMLEI